MKKFYLNKQFFDFLCPSISYPLGKEFYLHVLKCEDVPVSYRKFYRYSILIEFHFKDDAHDEFVPVFSGSVNLSSRCIRLVKVKYLLEDNVRQVYDQCFPLVPTWFLPCTNFSVFLHRVLLSLLIYKKKGWL